MLLQAHKFNDGLHTAYCFWVPTRCLCGCARTLVCVGTTVLTLAICPSLQAIKKIGIEKWPYRQLTTLKHNVLIPLEVSPAGCRVRPTLNAADAARNSRYCVALWPVRWLEQEKEKECALDVN